MFYGLHNYLLTLGWKDQLCLVGFIKYKLYVTSRSLNLKIYELLQVLKY